MATLKVTYKDGTGQVFTDVELFDQHCDYVTFYCFTDDEVIFNQKRVFLPLADIVSINMYWEENR